MPLASSLKYRMEPIRAGTTTHQIRLRGPWELTSDSSVATVSIPGHIVAAAGSRTISRRFGRPTNLVSTDTVWLTFASLPPDTIVRLNGSLLLTVAVRSECEVGPMMAERNLLELHIEAAGLVEIGEIAIEIRSIAD